MWIQRQSARLSGKHAARLAGCCIRKYAGATGQCESYELTSDHKAEADEDEHRCLVVQTVYVIVDDARLRLDELLQRSKQLKHGGNSTCKGCRTDDVWQSKQGDCGRESGGCV